MVKQLLVATIALLCNILPKFHGLVEAIVNFLSAVIFFSSIIKAFQVDWRRALLVLSIPVWLCQFWLVATISNFSNIHLVFALLVYLGYGILTGLSFSVIPATMAFFRPIRSFAFPLAWSVWEILPFKLFNWSAGYLFWSPAFIPSVYGQIGPVGVSLLMLSLISLFLSGLKRAFASLLAVFLLAEVLSSKKIEHAYRAENVQTVNVMLVQPNHDLQFKHDPKRLHEALLDLLGLVEESIDERPNYIIMPESALYYFTQVREGFVDADKILSNLAAYKPAIVGVLTVKDKSYYNSIAFVDKNGRLAGVYDKVKLMPFGEFLPLRSVTGFLLPFHPIEDFQSGDDVRVIELEGVKFSGMICYEDLFPELARRSYEKGAQALIVVSNDLWFGRWIAPYLHDRFAGFRAVESGLPLIRVSNTGISSVYSAKGYRTAFLQPNKKLAEVVELEVPVEPPRLFGAAIISQILERLILLFTAIFALFHFGKILTSET